MLVLSKCYCGMFLIDSISTLPGYSYSLSDPGSAVPLPCMCWGFLVRTSGWDPPIPYIVKIPNDDILSYTALYIHVTVIVDISRCLFNNEYSRLNTQEVIQFTWIFTCKLVVCIVYNEHIN